MRRSFRVAITASIHLQSLPQSDKSRLEKAAWLMTEGKSTKARRHIGKNISLSKALPVLEGQKQAFILDYTGKTYKEFKSYASDNSNRKEA